MAEKGLQRNISLLEGFMDLWKGFHQTLEEVAKSKAVNEETEQKFLAIKTEIAHRQSRMIEVLGLQSNFTDEVMSVLAQVISLKEFVALSATQAKRIEAQWHNLFMLMHSQMGKYETLLEEEQNCGVMRSVFRHPWLLLTVGVGALMVLYYFLGHRLVGS